MEFDNIIMTSWVLEDLAEFVDEKKRGVIDLVCDEELVVVGLAGWSGTARVYDINTGELKFKLQCNKLGDTPAPFSHDNVVVWLGTSIIVTVGTNDNTLSIWDRETGSLLAQDLHKNKEAIADMERVKNLDDDAKEEYFREQTAGMSEEEAYSFTMQIVFGIVPNDMKLTCLNVKDDLIYGGYDGGFFIIGNTDGEWKIIKKVELDENVVDIDFGEKWVVIAHKEDGKTALRFWDSETEDFTEGLGANLKRFSAMKMVFPHVFIIGGRKGNNTGVEIWNVETGEMVRHLLQGEKRYEFLSTNGKFLALCEHINTWVSGKEVMLKLAVYNIEQVVDQEIPDESLWSQSYQYSTLNLGGEHIRAGLNKNCLVVNHGMKNFSIKKIVQE